MSVCECVMCTWVVPGTSVPLGVYIQLSFLFKTSLEDILRRFFPVRTVLSFEMCGECAEAMFRKKCCKDVQML